MSPKSFYHVLKRFKCNQLYEFGNYLIPTILSRRRGSRLTCCYKIEIRGEIISFLCKDKAVLYRPGQALGFQEVESPRFPDNGHKNLAKLSVLHTGRLYPQETFLVLVSVRGWVNPAAIVRPEGSSQRHFSKTPSRIELETSRPQPTAPPRTPEFIM